MLIEAHLSLKNIFDNATTIKRKNKLIKLFFNSNNMSIKSF